MPAPAETMRRLVTMEEDAAESGRRLHEMVRAAIEQFNEGSLAKAVTIFSVAEKILAEKRVDPGVAKSIRETAHEGFDPNRLREFAEKEEAHPLLRQVLAFFPALSPDGLLADLQTEEKRERRRLLLALVEAHGAAGRAAVAALLESAIADAATDEGYFLRNIVYLLRRIPKPAEVPAEPEIERVASLSHPGFPAFLLKEAIAYLAQTKHEKAEQALIARLQDVEAMLLDPDEAIYDRKELHSLLDRIVTALARFGTRESARAVVTHGLKRQPQLGESFLRLADLGGQDFSADKETLERLASAIRDEMPRRVLGFTLQKNRPRLLSLVQAVAGTSDPSVRELLREVADRFPGEEAGHAAAKVLSAPAAPHGPAAAAAPGASSAHTAPAHASAGAPAPASLAGDLELFGLPNLLQNLAQSELTGSLTIVDRAGETAGTLWLAGGRMQKARVGLLEGDEAVYQLFEKPMPGTFSFVSPSVGGSSEKKPQGRDLMPLLLEGMRRYDEFQRARALVPDKASFGPAAKKPTRPPEERDPSLLRAIWTKASSGSTPSDCEAEIPTDAFRIRRLFAHWLEEGALEPK
jgi:hypothetical protein